MSSFFLLVAGLVALIALTLWVLKGPGRGPIKADFPKLIGSSSASEASGERRHPQQLRIMVWNMHYGHANELDHFAKHRPDDVAQTVDGIAETIRKAKVDVVMLQEVDFNADRSHNVDQIRRLAEAAEMPYFAYVTTWNARYIPFPFAEPARWLGRVHSGQGVLSRFPIRTNHRLRLPQPAEQPFWYNAFYLNRAVQVVELEIAGEQPLQLFNVHLEAFSDANRLRQARLLRDLVASSARKDGRFVVAGDFNSVPPNATQKKGFKDEPETDFSDDETISLIRAGIPATDLLRRFKDPSRAFTFPADAPSRQLDHVFTGRAWSGAYAWVQNSPETARLSDHLPLRVVLTGKPSVRLNHHDSSPPKTGSKPPKTSAPIKGRVRGAIEMGPGGLGVELRAPERLNRKTPVQGAPPPPPKKLNPEGWLEGAPEVPANP